MTLDAVFILLFLVEDWGRNLINPFFSPNKLNCVINAAPEIIVVAIPICSAVNNRVFKIQKMKPKTAVTKVLAIR